MTKEKVIETFLNGKKAVDFYGDNAPETVTVVVNEYGDEVVFNQILKLDFTGDETETSILYQSSIVNSRGEYPIIEVVVQKYGRKRIEYKFNRNGWNGCRAW